MLTKDKVRLLKRWAAGGTIPWEQTSQALHDAIDAIERLPADKDGNPVAPGSALYGPVTGRRYIADTVINATQDRNFGEEEDHVDNSGSNRVGELEVMPVDRLHSTRELASNARQAGGAR